MRNRLILLLLSVILCSCNKQELKGHTLLKGGTMGTTYSVKIYPKLESQKELNLKQGIKEVLDRVNSKMSTYRNDSSLTLLNNGPAHKLLSLESELFNVIKRSLDISEQTKGAFDVTVGPLVNLWGFGAKGKRRTTPPSIDEISQRVKKIGRDKIELSAQKNSLLKKNGYIYIDLSAIAKGYGVDEVSRYLLQKGHQDHMVEIGGEIRLAGFKDPQLEKRWNIAIEVPYDNRRVKGRVLALTDISMATSGDYRNFFNYKGKRYSHTIDPRTGVPIDHNLTSVTVLDKRCMDADAFATSLMVMGESEGLKFSNELGIKAIFYVKDGKGSFKEFVSRAMEKFLKEHK